MPQANKRTEDCQPLQGMPLCGVPRFILTLMLLLPATAWPDELAEVQFKKILMADNQALQDILGWIDEEKETLRTSPAARDRLALQIRTRLGEVRQQYETFLKAHPKHARGRVAYGSFLTNLDDREAARAQWKLALKNDPGNAAALNNIATHIGTISLRNEITDQLPTAFQSQQKAIRLAPKQALYRHNFATLLNTFPKEACTHLKLTERQLTQRALRELKTAMTLAPVDFEIAADYAETFLDLKPFPHARAIAAWKNAAALAKRPEEQDWAHLQMAVAHLKSSHWQEADFSLRRMRPGSHGPLVKQLKAAIAAQRKRASKPKAP